jgi:hypothetical protein
MTLGKDYKALADLSREGLELAFEAHQDGDAELVSLVLLSNLVTIATHQTALLEKIAVALNADV